MRLQSSVKIYIKLIRVLFWINFLLFTSLSTLGAKNPDKAIIANIREHMGAGVNLSVFEHYWISPDSLYNVDLTSKLDAIANAGFKTVRLPVAFDLFFQPNSSNLQNEILDKLLNIYFDCYNKKLNLIITYHYGKLTNENISTGEIERIAWIWKQVQQHFKGHGYDCLFFELYNEPTIERNKWKDALTKLVSNIRYEDPNRIYIIGGTDYNSLNELMEMGKLPDDKIIYTYHYYEPFIFTHQGADWTENKTYLTGLRFPYKRRGMPHLKKESIGTSTEQDYKKYPTEANSQYIADRTKQIAVFCARNNMPLICSETGVITNADNKSRKRYLKAITDAFYEYQIPGILWDYDQKFSITTDSAMKGLKQWLKRSKRIIIKR